MFYNHPHFIIIHFTDLTTPSKINTYHRDFYNQPILLTKSKFWNERLYQKVTHTQSHYIIDSVGVTHSIIPDDIPVFHHFSNNAIHITAYNKYNFTQPSDTVLSSLHLKIFEIQQKYDIPLCNIMSDFDSRVILNEINYKTWNTTDTYKKNDIVLMPSRVVFQVLNDEITPNEILHSEWLSDVLKGGFTDINIIDSYITLIGYTSVETPTTNDKIFVYDVEDDTVGETGSEISESKIIDLIDGKTYSIREVGTIEDGAIPFPLGTIKISQHFVAPVGGNDDVSIKGKYYLKVKPISDYNVTKKIANQYNLK